MAFYIYTYNHSKVKDASLDTYILNEASLDTDVNISVVQDHYGVDVVTIYLDYQKGDEDSLSLTFETELFNNESNKFYNVSYLNGDGVVVPRSMAIQSSGRYRIPVAVSVREKKLKINFAMTGGTDGNRGTVEAYVHP